MSVQGQLITAIVEDPKSFNDVIRFGINNDVFSGEEQKIFGFISEYMERYGKMPSRERITEDFPAYKWERPRADIHDLMDRAIIAAKETFVSARLIEIGKLIVNRNSKKAFELLSETAADMSRLSVKANVHRFKEVDRRIKLYKSQVREHVSPYGIKTGFEAIDRATLGIQNGDFVVIFGRLEVGKSTFLQRLLLTFWQQDKNALLVSMEMKGDVVLSRLDAMMAQFDYYQMRSLNMTTRTQKAWTNAAQQIKGKSADITVLDGFKRVTPSAIGEMIKVYRPDIVGVDGITLMQPNSFAGDKFTSDWQKVQAISRAMKEVAMNTNVAIVALTQAARSAVELGTRVENIGYSDAIGQDADIVIGIDPMEGAPTCRLISLHKNRGFGKKLRVVVEFDQTRMIYIQKEVLEYDQPPKKKKS